VLPKVTILIPTYRRPKSLRRALKSALTQRFADFEVRVCDDASGDETGAVVAEFSATDKRVKYILREKNLGMIGNFVRSIEDVRTPFFTALDDDVLLPNFLESGLAQLKHFPEAPIYCGQVVFSSEEGDCLGGPAGPSTEGVHRPPALMEMMRSQSLGGVIFRTEGLRRTGGLDPRSVSPLIRISSGALRRAGRSSWVSSPASCISSMTLRSATRSGQRLR
jgi:glycosyltransferase involved in cell wall biosynthesis